MNNHLSHFPARLRPQIAQAMRRDPNVARLLEWCIRGVVDFETTMRRLGIDPWPDSGPEPDPISAADLFGCETCEHAKFDWCGLVQPGRWYNTGFLEACPKTAPIKICLPKT